MRKMLALLLLEWRTATRRRGSDPALIIAIASAALALWAAVELYVHHLAR